MWVHQIKSGKANLKNIKSHNNAVSRADIRNVYKILVGVRKEKNRPGSSGLRDGIKTS
jgi:hypothetical protein